MKDIGLSQASIKILIDNFSAYSEITEVVLYGSRAKGNFTLRSDIDLVVKGNVSRHIISEILQNLEDSNLLQSVDLLLIPDM